MSIKEYKDFYDEMVTMSESPSLSNTYISSDSPSRYSVFTNFSREGNPFAKSKKIAAKESSQVEMNDYEKQLEQDHIVEDEDEEKLLKGKKG